MYTEIESEILKGKLAKAIRKTNYEQFIEVMRRFVSEYQDEVEWSIKDYAILLTDHGPHFTLSAWLDKGYNDNLTTVIDVVTSEKQPPRYVIQAMENWIILVLNFTQPLDKHKKLIGEWVERHFNNGIKKQFFSYFPNYK